MGNNHNARYWDIFTRTHIFILITYTLFTERTHDAMTKFHPPTWLYQLTPLPLSLSIGNLRNIYILRKGREDERTCAQYVQKWRVLSLDRWIKFCQMHTLRQKKQQIQFLKHTLKKLKIMTVLYFFNVQFSPYYIPCTYTQILSNIIPLFVFDAHLSV